RGGTELLFPARTAAARLARPAPRGPGRGRAAVNKHCGGHGGSSGGLWRWLWGSDRRRPSAAVTGPGGRGLGCLLAVEAAGAGRSVSGLAAHMDDSKYKQWCMAMDQGKIPSEIKALLTGEEQGKAQHNSTRLAKTGKTEANSSNPLNEELSPCRAINLVRHNRFRSSNPAT
uniref:Uncharacterized protein n=2 Tax=Apteryx owenii TaxID=8824 RepID=A0A8B9PLV6_APTOW